MPFIQNSQNQQTDPNLQNNVNTMLNGVTEYTPQPVQPAQPVANTITPQNLYHAEDLNKTLNNQVLDINKLQRQPAETQISNLASTTGMNVEQLQTKTYTLEELFREAIKRNASDIHLVVGYRAIVRVDGALIELNSNILTPDELFNFAKKIAEKRKDINLEDLKQADLSYTIDDRRFRVNIFKRMGNFSIVCRLIPAKILTVEELGLPMIYKEFGTYGGGLVLVTGPTGSGKSTTLASIINEINLKQSKHIVTLEDPIEFIFPKGKSLINQREFGIDFDSWTDALKSMLRQDPDVVLVGEMRDLETISSAITVSETGHLVFATLHTNSASQSIDRMIDVFPENQQPQIRSQLASVIMAIASQRLVPLSQGGRRSVQELMIATPAVKNAIREGKSYQIDNMIQTGQEFGMVSMEKTLAEMVKKNEISLEVAKETTVKPRELEILLNK